MALLLSFNKGKNMIEKEFQLKLLSYIRDRFGTQGRYAERMGVSGAYISAIIRGVQPPSKAILDDIGMEKITTTTYIEKA